MNKWNQNLRITLLSIGLTILNIFLVEEFLYLTNSIGIHILNDSVLGNVMLEVSILVAQLFVVCRYFKKSRMRALGLNSGGRWKRQFCCGVFIGLIITLFTYSIFFALRIGVFRGLGFQFFSTNVVGLYIVGLSFRALFAGVCEEVFFRGVLLNYLCKYKGNTVGLILSSLIFMIFHCMRYSSITQLISVFFCGLALGVVFLVTKSLYMSIGIHFATDFFMNLVNLRVQPSLFVFDINSKFGIKQLDEYSFRLFAIAYLLLLLLVILFRKKLQKNNLGGKKEFSKEKVYKRK